MKTNITWTDYSQNFIKWFCTKTSPGCKNCYMFTMAERWPQNASDHPVWRPNAIKDLYKIPTGAFVFVGDMYDTYHEQMPTEWIHRVHNLAAYERPDLQFQMLTKRIERVAHLAPHLIWPDNLWLGCTVENADYTWRIDYLRQLPAKTKFISFEPLLGDVGEVDLSGIDMAIVGAESGAGRRPFDKQWARNIRTQCRKYDTAFFYKQSSGMKPGTDPYLDGQMFHEFPRGMKPLKGKPEPAYKAKDRLARNGQVLEIVSERAGKHGNLCRAVNIMMIGDKAIHVNNSFTIAPEELTSWVVGKPSSIPNVPLKPLPDISEIKPALNTITNANVLDYLKAIKSDTIHTCISSPPYWGLRDYGTDPVDWPTVRYSPLPGMPKIEIPAMKCSLGLESTLEEFIGHIILIYREIFRILHPTGTAWVNMGDSYASTPNGRSAADTKAVGNDDRTFRDKPFSTIGNGIKPKDLVGQPWRLALALQADGWYLRSDIVWHKCLSGGAIVYAKTQKGEMPMMVKDLARLDPSTIKLWNGKKWTPMLSIHETSPVANRKELSQMQRRKRYLGEEAPPLGDLEVELRSGEKIGCTRNHVWPTMRGDLRADQLEIGDVIKSTSLPEPADCLSPELIPDEIGWFVGLYIAEGSISDKCIQISSHVDETERFDRLSDIAKQYGGVCNKYQTSENGMTINIFSRILLGIIDEYVSGKTAKGKHLNVKCWQRSNNFLHYVLQGYLDGDGHFDTANNRWRVGFSRNYNLASDLRTIGARLDIHIRLKLAVSYVKGDNKKYPTFRGEIRFRKSNHHNTKYDTEIVGITQSRAQKSWDIEVEDDPHLFALASGVLTHNSNGMPESVNDRPTKNHEYVFLLAKSERYYYDREAIAEPVKQASFERAKRGYTANHKNMDVSGVPPGHTINSLHKARANGEGYPMPATKNKRTVWTIPAKGFPDAHFATFPKSLIRPMILAGCPPKVCPKCGSPYVRITEKEFIPQEDVSLERGIKGAPGQKPQYEENQWGGVPRGSIATKTTGWQPTCKCEEAGEPMPGTVLDPFMGSGTTAIVAKENGRNYMGCDLNLEYVEMANKRLSKPTEVDMFTAFGIPTNSSSPEHLSYNNRTKR